MRIFLPPVISSPQGSRLDRWWRVSWQIAERYVATKNFAPESLRCRRGNDEADVRGEMHTARPVIFIRRWTTLKKKKSFLNVEPGDGRRVALET